MGAALRAPRRAAALANKAAPRPTASRRKASRLGERAAKAAERAADAAEAAGYVYGREASGDEEEEEEEEDGEERIRRTAK